MDVLASIIGNYTTSITYICALLLATFAVTIIFKTSTTTNFAQGTIAAFGCYFGTYFFLRYGVPMWACLIIGTLFGVICGIFVDVVIFRNGRSVNLAGKQIITMGLVTVLGNLIPIAYYYLEPPLIPTFASDAQIIVNMGSSNFAITVHSLVCLAITVVVLAVLFLLLRFSKWGLGVRTTASNEIVAQMMGVNTHIITAASWGIAGGLGAMAAIMYVSGPGTMNSAYFMTEFQVNAFLACILGGFSTFYGPLIGALIIPLFKSTIGLFNLVNGFEWITRWNVVIVYLFALIIILIKPNGIFGKKIAKKV